MKKFKLEPATPIKSDTEYDQILKRIEQIFEARPGTLEGREFNLLAKKLKNYDNKHYPLR